MKFNIQFLKMQDSGAMSEHVINKLNKLRDKYDQIIGANVFFKYENNSDKNGKICEIDLSVPGPNIFASSKKSNYELAVKETIQDLEIQLKKRKASIKAH